MARVIAASTNYRMLLRCASIAFFFISASGSAAIISVGDVTPAIPPNGTMNGATLVVGGAGNGSVTVTDGSLLTANRGTVARDSSSSGYVEVSGADSRWLLDQYLELGAKGHGELVIRNGGAVSTDTARFGGGTAMFVVDGPVSSFTTTRTFTVLNALLDITGGGRATTGNTYFGTTTPGFGVAHVDGQGSLWEIAVMEVVGNGNIKASRGGTITADSISLGTNLNAHATLEVTDPGTVVNAPLIFGGSTSSSSGVSSTSEAVIRNGATLVGNVGMGANPAVTSSLVVQDPGTTWKYSAANIGADGVAALTIRNGAKVDGGWATMGLFSSGFGKAIVEGPGTEWNIGTTNSSPPSGLSMGIYGDAELTIRDGALVTSKVTELGQLVRTSAKVTVSGAGTVFDHGSLTISERGQDSTLEILGGAKAMGTYASIGSDYGGRGQVLVQDPGSLWSIDYLSIAATSHNGGTVRVYNGGRIEAGALYLGPGSEADALLEVDGVGSALDVTGHLAVGAFGNYTNATLSIKNAGKVTSASAEVGNLLSELATVEIAGPGSAWRIAEELSIGGSRGLSYTPVNTVTLATGAMLEVGERVDMLVHSNLLVDGTSFVAIGGDGTPTPAGAVHVAADGALTGNGQVTANVLNYGLVSPGVEDTLKIARDFVQFPSGMLSFALGGSAAEQYGRLAIDGQATLAGTLAATLSESFTPHHADTFTILTSTQPIIGRFTDFSLPALPDGLGWKIDSPGNSIRLTVVVVPEPPTLAASIFALILALGQSTRFTRA